MPDYESISWNEALRFAKEESGQTAEEIAEKMGVNSSVIRRYLRNDASYAPGMDKIPALCRALGNTILLDWLAAQVGSQSSDEELKIPQAQSRAEVLTAVAAVTATLGEVQRILADSTYSGIDHFRAQRIREILSRLQKEIRHAMLMLKDLARDARGQILYSPPDH